MNEHHPILRVATRITASLKPACLIVLPLFLAQSPLRALYLPEQPGRGYPIASLTPAELAAWNGFIDSAERQAIAAKNHLGFAQTSAQQQNVGGVRQGCEGARTAALAAVASANRANALALSIATTTSAQNATAWANQAANLLRIFTTPPAPLPTPRRILVPVSEIDNVANLKSKIGYFGSLYKCCGQVVRTDLSSGSIVGRFGALTVAHAFYQPETGFAANVTFFLDPANPESFNRKMFTVAVKRGYRDAANSGNLAQRSDADLGMGLPSSFWPFTSLFTNNGALRTAMFDPNFHNSSGREGVITPYRTAGFVDNNSGGYRAAFTNNAQMIQVNNRTSGSLIYTSVSINPASFGLGPGTSGGPLVRERHQSGFLWGGYTYLEVVGVLKGGVASSSGTFVGFRVFNLTDLYFIDYYTGTGPGRFEYSDDGLDSREYGLFE